MASKTYSPSELDALWKQFDYNGNGILSLAEIDLAVKHAFPQYADNKPVLLRAYKAADHGKKKDGFIEKDEFARLIRYLAHYETLFEQFKGLDKDGDHRVDFKEFEKGFATAGIKTNETPRQLFDEIDKNHGGYILFDEFCGVLAQKKLHGQ
ncbi:hypothetical protein HKX48_000231 [Thoreauomyces humboldtii]|nr:hypothetical protein HKX48_000231 [Thoreauomyces humboldtii]